MSWFLRYGLPVLGIAAGVGAFLILMPLEAMYILPSAVILPANEQLNDWLPVFRMAQQEWILIPALTLAAVWFIFSIASPSFRGDHRLVWLILWVVAVLSALLCILLEKLEQGTGFIPEFLTVMNAVILFWLATAPFSTITNKFAPAGSLAVRKLW